MLASRIGDPAKNSFWLSKKGVGTGKGGRRGRWEEESLLLGNWGAIED